MSEPFLQIIGWWKIFIPLIQFVVFLFNVNFFARHLSRFLRQVK